MGAWIEIAKMLNCHCLQVVAPLVGAWIEIYVVNSGRGMYLVAPLVGAWIEIMLFYNIEFNKSSLLSWERGLKSKQVYWRSEATTRRSSRGSVD